MTTLSNNSQMHNDIMAVGSRERPPMLAPSISAVDDQPVDIYATIREMWLAIECLQQGESINKQDVETKLFWEFGKFTSRVGESIKSYYSRFYKMMNEMVRNKLKVDTMQQHQNEVNEIRAEKIVIIANLLALVPTAQHYPNTYSLDTYYQAPKPHKIHTSSSRHKTSTNSHATTRNKGKEIAEPITPPSESASEEDSDPEQAQRDKDMQKNIALIANYIKNIYKPIRYVVGDDGKIYKLA
ncbi:hypothetical protein Tco_1056563 [Tanacetum coccineum]|uniref:Gag-Pol polyprotein n=1 Tax=Tanacetum coccineum TaxID=301880 RepID=A0ABQ5H306_9ASTR